MSLSISKSILYFLINFASLINFVKTPNQRYFLLFLSRLDTRIYFYVYRRLFHLFSPFFGNKSFLLGFFVCFRSQGITNFHNARGHYGEISPCQQPITARDFTGCNPCHIIIYINDLLFLLKLNRGKSTCEGILLIRFLLTMAVIIQFRFIVHLYIFNMFQTIDRGRSLKI